MNEDEYGSFPGTGSFSSGSVRPTSNLIFKDRYPGDTYVGDIGSEYTPGQYGSEYFMARPVARPATSVILPPVRPASFVFTPNDLGSGSSSSVLYNNNHGANYVRDIGSEFPVDQSGLSGILPPVQPASVVPGTSTLVDQPAPASSNFSPLFGSAGSQSGLSVILPSVQPASSKFTPLFRSAGTPQNNNVGVNQVASFNPATGAVTIVTIPGAGAGAGAGAG